MIIKSLIIVKANFHCISGGYRRLHEILKYGKSEGIEYTVVTDKASFANYRTMFSDFPEICRQYKVYFIDSDIVSLANSPRRLGEIVMLRDSFLLSLAISKIALQEDVDLIVYPSENTREMLACYLASLMSHKPWTAIFQPGPVLNQANLFQPTFSLGPLNPYNIFRHLSSKNVISRSSTVDKLGLSLDFLTLLKIAEQTGILTVSKSVAEEIYYLDPKIEMFSIIPGNGIDLNEFPMSTVESFKYDAVFFGRMIPGKGFLDLPDIWKIITEKMPNAKLAVCGIAEDKQVIKKFLSQISNYGLTKNVDFLGQQSRAKLLNIVANSYLTINPSYGDSFSLLILESLACGTPVVSYDISANNRNFGTCASVFRTPLGDKARMADMILRVFTDMDRRSLDSKARKFAALYDWRNVLKAEKEQYSHLITRYTPARG